MAHAGATFMHRAAQPRNRPVSPSSRKIWSRNFGIDNCSGRVTDATVDDVVVVVLIFANEEDVNEEDVVEEDELSSASSPMCRNTCCRVLPTSNGVVIRADTAPATAPEVKLSTNTTILL